MPAQTIAALDSVSKLYGQFAALRRVTFQFSSACCYVLLGENGAGKSTLLRVLAGLLTPSIGQVTVLGMSPKEARAEIGYMSHSPMLYEELSAAENLAYFAKLYAGHPAQSVLSALEQVGLDPDLPRPVGRYSQGMRQRVSLARALLIKPRLLLLDEPFSNVDAASATRMRDLLANVRNQGGTVVLTTHQRELAEPVADYVLTMQDGSLISAVQNAEKLQ